MTKLDFLSSLRQKLKGLPQNEVEERLNFYNEMIADRIEEGYLEEDAVSAIGSVDLIAAQIIADIPFSKIAKEKIKPKRKLEVWEIVLLILGFPIWVSLLIAAFTVILSFYIVIWSVIISLWSVFVSFIATAFGGFVAGIVLLLTKRSFTGIALIGTGFVAAGLSILMFFGCKWATKGILLLTKTIAKNIKNCFIKKGDAK